MPYKPKNLSHYAKVFIVVLLLGLAAWAMVVLPARATAEPARNPQTFEWISHYGGPAQGLAVQGNFAYAGFGAEFAILDMSALDRPQRVGYTLLSDQILDIHVAGSYAFVRSQAHWWVLDVSQVTQPTIIHEAELHWTQDSTLAEGYVYVAAAGDGLHIIPLTAPDQAFFYDTPGSVNQVAVIGNYAYVFEFEDTNTHTGERGLRVLNISDPTRPAEIKFYPLGQNIADIAATNNYLYLITGDGDLQIVDPTDPTQLSEVGFYDTPGYLSRVIVEGNYAYLFIPDDHDLQIIDISSPAQPTPLTTLTFSSSIKSLAVVNSYLYLAVGLDGLQVLDITDPSQPTEVSRYGAESWRVMAEAGGYVYRVTAEQQLQLVDFSDPQQPLVVGSYDAPTPIAKVIVANEHAYVILTSGDLRILRVTDPTHPLEVGVYTLPGLILDMVIRDNYAYIGTTESSLHIIDLSAPAAPQEIGLFQLTSGWVLGVAVEGDYAYLLADQLHVVDISNPTTPRPFGSADYTFSDPAESPTSLVVKEQYVFIGGARIDIVNGDWLLIDATNPAAPASLNLSHTQSLRGPVGAVAIAGNDLYIGWAAGLQRLDISNPARPLDVGLYPLVGADSLDRIEDIVISGQQLYVSFRTGQLFVLETKPLPSLPKPSLNLTLANHLGGKTNALVIQDNYAYAGFGPELAVLDIANPSQPIRAGYLILSQASGSQPVIIEDITVAGAYAYVLSQESLYIVDISNPAAPGEVDALPLAGGGRAITMRDQAAYVLQRYCSRPGSHTQCSDVLHKFDLTNPTAPAEVGRYAISNGSYSGENTGSQEVAAVDNYLVVSDPQIGLKITDMAGPTSGPVFIGAAHIALQNDYAYITDENHGGLQIFDLSNPLTPTLASRYDTSGRLTGSLAVRDNVLYFAEGRSYDEMQKGTGTYGLRILEVTNPLTPTDLGFFSTLGPVQDLKIAGRHAYLATTNGIQILDLTNPAHPLAKGVYSSMPAVLDLATRANYLYSIAGDPLDLHVLDTAKPEQPQIVAVSRDPTASRRPVRQVRLANEYAYILDGTRVRVVDISVPTAPTELGYLTNSWADVIIVDNYAYTCSNATLYIMAVSNPITWTQVATRNLPGGYCPSGIAAAGYTLYLAGPEIGLRLFNISDPAAPVELGKVENIRPYYVSVSGDYAYLVNSEKGTQVYDVSNPAAPALVGEVELGLFGTSWHPQDVLATGQYLYLADGPIGLRVLDVSDPTTPTEVGYYSLPTWAKRIALVNNYIYVAAQEGGLFIFQPASGD